MHKSNLPLVLARALAVLLIFGTAAWAASKETILYNFAGGSGDGEYPIGGLVSDRAGNLYGTTGAGGSYGNCSPFGETCGVVFELTPASGGPWKESVLYTFTGGVDGGLPESSLTIDASGNLYGTATIGGTYGVGNVFMLTPGSGGWTQSVLYSFAGGSDGAYPKSAAPLLLKNGNLYGTTYAGGGNNCLNAPSGCGVVFQLVPGNGSWTENVLWRFTNGADGAFPYSSIVADNTGSLYGTTTQGGYLQGNCQPYGCGNVFQLQNSSNGWTLNTLYSFTGGTDGGQPWSTPTLDSAGNLYATASSFGSYYYGTIFELKPATNGWKFRVLYTFMGPPDAGVSEAGLLQRGTTFYGTSYGGGTGSGCFFGSPCGTVFKLVHVKKSWKESVLYSFTNNGTDGIEPEAALISDKKGNLYGTGYAGGKYGYGTVFKIKP